MDALDHLFSLTDDTSFYPEHFYQNRWKGLTARAVALVVLVLMVHLPLLGGKSLWGDQVSRRQDAAAASAHGVAMAWLQPRVWERPPLAKTLEFLLNKVGGAGPEADSGNIVLQSASVLLHAANCVLLWFVLRRLQIPGAWLAAAIFAVHPAQVQSIAWMAQQERLWAALFGLASLLLILRAAGIPQPLTVPTPVPIPGKIIVEAPVSRWVILGPLMGGFVLFIAALACEPAMFGLPLLAMAVVAWRRGIDRADWKTAAPFLAASLIIIALGSVGGGAGATMASRHAGESTFGAIATSSLTTIHDALRISARALVPWPMVAIYTSRPLHALSLRSYWAPALVGLLLLGAILTRKRFGMAPLIVLVCFVCLMPTAWDARDGEQILWLIPGRDAMQYLLGLPLLVAITAVLVESISRFGRPTALAYGRLMLGAGLVGTLCIFCWLTSSAYASTESLWLAAIDGAPADPNAHAPLALWYLEQGRAPSAMYQMRDTDPSTCRDYQILVSYGRVLEANGRESDAIDAYHRATALETIDARAQTYLAAAYTKAGRNDEAQACLESAISKFPNDPELRNDLGLLLSQKGQTTPAIGQFRQAIDLDASFTPARVNLANALFSQGKLPEAAEQLQEVVKIDPRNFDAFHNAGVMLCQLGDYVRAQPMLQAAVSLRPDSAEARNDLAVSLVATDNLADASVQLNAALGLRPDYAAARQNLDVVERRLKAKGESIGGIPSTN